MALCWFNSKNIRLPPAVFVSEATQLRHPVSSSLAASKSDSSGPSEVSLCIYSPVASALRSHSAHTNMKHNQTDTLISVSQCLAVGGKPPSPVFICTVGVR